MPSEPASTADAAAQAGALLNAQLCAAVGTGNHGAVQRLLNTCGVDINTGDRNGLTPLIIAAARGDRALVRLLVARAELRVNIQADGYTALMVAATENHHEIVDILLTRKDLDINAINGSRDTALTIAAAAGHLNVVESLVKSPGLDANAANSDGASALILAAIAGNDKIVDRLKTVPGILLDAGDRTWSTALMHAVVHRHAAVVKSLKGFADINAANAQQWTALMLAADNGSTEILDLLLTFDQLEINRINSAKQTALMIAVRKGHFNQAERLLGAGAKHLRRGAGQQSAGSIAHSGTNPTPTHAHFHFAKDAGYAAISIAAEDWSAVAVSDWLADDSESTEAGEAAQLAAMASHRASDPFAAALEDMSSLALSFEPRASNTRLH